MGNPGAKAQRLRTPMLTAPERAGLRQELERQVSGGAGVESTYRAVVPANHRKRLGQFFTPRPWLQAEQSTLKFSGSFVPF